MTPLGAGRRLAALIAAALAAAPACHHPPPCTLPAPVAGAAPLMWRARGPDGAVVWLFGTLHHGGRNRVPAAVWEALDGSDRFVSELGDAEPDPERIAELARLPRGPGLDQLLPADDWYELRDAMAGVMREDDLRRARPWFAMARLTSHLSHATRPSMDDALAAHARERGLGVDALESWEQQLRALTETVTVADLQDAIHARRTMKCELDRLLAWYAAGDQEALARYLRLPDPETLIDARNRRWLPHLEGYLRGRGAFVAVGLGHLLGDHGLIAALRAAGYTVERVGGGGPAPGRPPPHP